MSTIPSQSSLVTDDQAYTVDCAFCSASTYAYGSYPNTRCISAVTLRRLPWDTVQNYMQ